jgi:hypothetical protein
VNKATRALANGLRHDLGDAYAVEHGCGTGNTICIRRADDASSFPYRCHVQDRVVYGRGVRGAIGIVTGHELISTRRDGVSFPDVGGGPILGRGWYGRLLAAVKKAVSA